MAGGKTMRAAGLAAALAAGVLAAAAASALPASAAVIASFSAKSGEFRGGRLILPGVSDRVRYLTDAGRSRTMSLGWLHQRVFLPGKPPTGMLHISGRSDDPAFTLSNPRYNASRQTVSYNAKPLPGTPLSRRGPRRAPLRFGDASLTILPHPALAVGDNGGHNCQMNVQNTPSTPRTLLFNRHSSGIPITGSRLPPDKSLWTHRCTSSQTAAYGAAALSMLSTQHPG
jgi:hypothetical protein